MAYASGGTSKSDEARTEQLKCPICLDVYNNPRVLNCLHSFCEPCIQSLVIKRQEKTTVPTGILCPLCRTETLSPCLNTPLTEWVKQLPLGKPLLPLLEGHGHEANKVKYCTVCKIFNKTTCAQYFCRQCDQLQCENCTLFHSQFPATKSHQVVNIDEQSAQIAEKLNLCKLEYCPQHPDREVELYCDEDKKFCCFECQFLHHRSCKQIGNVTQLGQTLKEGDRSQQLENHMDMVQKQIGIIVRELENTSSTIENQAVEIPQKIREIRYKIVRVLDQLVSDITAECGQLKKHHTMELDDKITSMKSLEAAVTTSRSFLDTIMKHGTTKQVYIVIQKLEGQTSEYSTQVTAAQTSMDTVHLRMSVSDSLNKIIQTSQVLARVAATHLQCKTRQIPDQVTASQSQHSVPIADCVIQKSPLVQIQKQRYTVQPTIRHGQKVIQSRIGIQHPCYSGAEYLPDGRLVAVDRNNSLCCLMDDSFNVTSYARLPSQPIDLTVIGPTEVVVTLPDIKQLQKVGVVGSTITLTGIVHCYRAAYSVSRISDTELAVGWNRGMGIISMDGQEKMYTNRDKLGREIRFSGNDRIQADGKLARVYQTKEKANAVYCIGYTGDVDFTYTNNLMGPRGLALDRDGNLYVCGSGTVHQVSPTGQPINIINTYMFEPYSV